MEKHDPLLIDTLRDLRAGVNGLRATQDEMKERLYAMDDRLDTKLNPLSARVSALEAGAKDIERKARQWGAIGGAGAVVTAGITAVMALFAKMFTFGTK